MAGPRWVGIGSLELSDAREGAGLAANGASERGMKGTRLGSGRASLEETRSPQLVPLGRRTP